MLGAGNVLAGDDGAGVAALEALRAADIEARVPGVQLVEAGTAAFDAVALLDEGVRSLVVIDAVSGGGPAGAVYRFTLDEVSEEGDPQRASLHQVTLLEALRLAELAGRRFQEVVIIGVEPALVAWGAGLSRAVQARMPEIVKLIEREVARMAGDRAGDLTEERV